MDAEEDHESDPFPVEAVTIGKETDVETLELDGGAGLPKEAPANLEVADKTGSEATKLTIAFGVVLYATCSSTLLIINKVAVEFKFDPSFLLFCQFGFSSVAVRMLKCFYPDLDIELLTWSKVKPFSLATLVFYLCLLSNVMALKYVNVETVIVVRSCSPMMVAALDYCALGRDLPNVRGVLALLAIAAGAFLYVMADKGFRIDGYAWLAVYFASIVIEMVFVKFIVDTVPMSTWTRVYYNNTLSLPLAILSGLSQWRPGQSQDGNHVVWGFGAIAAMLLSCFGSFGISYAGFNLRKLVSATTFTVVGVVCKIVTVLINDVIWTKHSNAVGHGALMICIAAGFFYERSKQR